MLWTYADRQDDGSYKRVGGGPYDADTDTYGQGAFNADDMARAAVVYLRHWQQTGDASSRPRLRAAARPDLPADRLRAERRQRRALDAARRHAEPERGSVEQPDPSDSDASYWLARTVWALGEGYAAFQKADPAFARFLARRLDLAVGALDRQVLDAYGDYLDIDGRRTPAWLIADGADASAEAVLGLASYVRAGGTGRARRVMPQLSNGIAEMAGGDARTWPFGGVLPWALSRSDWHAWSSQMPAALAARGRVLGDRHLRRVAARDSFTFDPWMLTSGGPDNGRLPARADATQIAYGVDSRVQSLLATRRQRRDRLAGVVAAWFFGANASRRADLRPGHRCHLRRRRGRRPGNQNSGAESTIHGLLTMLALDAHPAARGSRATATVPTRSATRPPGRGRHARRRRHRRHAGSTWTGESKYAGAGYASLPDGGTATFDLGSHPARC